MDEIIRKVKLFFEDKVFACICLFVLCLFAYRNMLQNGFLLDDFRWIVHWNQIRAELSIPQLLMMPFPTEIEGMLYVPFRNILHTMNVGLFGAMPFGHHLFSLLAHCVATFLVYKISFKLTAQGFVSFLAALIFTLHPAQTSLVSFASGGVEILGACFIFLSFLLFQQIQQPKSDFNRAAYAGSLVFFFLALGTHQAAVALPFLFLWFAVNFLNKEFLQRKGLVLWPFFAVSFLFMGFKFFLLSAFTPMHLLGNSVVLTFFVMIKALARHIILFCFPVVLSLNHTLSDGIFSFAPADFDKIAMLSQSFFDVSVILSSGIVGALIYVMCALTKKNPLVRFCCGWFLITLIPFLFAGGGHLFFAQKYGYIASMGGALLIAVGLNKLSCLDLKKGARWGAPCFVAVVSLLLCFYGVKVMKRNSVMSAEVLLLEADIKHVSESRLSQIALVEAYIENRLFDRAHKQLVQLRKRYVDDPQMYFLAAQIYAKQRKDVLAIRALKESLQFDPVFGDAHYQLAEIYQKWGEDELAMDYLRQAYYAYSKKGAAGNLEMFVDAFLSKYQNDVVAE
ncbi:hypothetical protein ACFL49_00735 [Candidatus Omnitrophota bacterium]